MFEIIDPYQQTVDSDQKGLDELCNALFGELDDAVPDEIAEDAKKRAA